MIYFERLDSTNSYIKEHYLELDDFDMVYTANQIRGRGRNDHTWEVEPNKNATFSVLIKDVNIVKKFNQISIVTGLVVADYLSLLGIENVSIKWPNDVYVGDDKICGILLEGNLPNYIIIGVGINVNQSNFKGFSATSIKNHIGMKIDPKLVALDIFDALKYELKHLDDNLDKYLEKYEKYDYLLNKTISAMINNQEVIGKAFGITNDGLLKIFANNEVKIVNSNEVNLVKKID